jgi:DNA-binding FadR family transcriptional regulator
MNKRKHTNLTHQVSAALGRRIAVGEHPPGIALPPEDELVREFGTSRTVIREAVKMLSAKGLVNTRPRRGTIVLPESDWNLADPDILDWLLHRKNVVPLILEFAEIRLAIEPAAAALAARVADDDARAEMMAAIGRMKDAAIGEDDPLDADIAFHVAILSAARNRFFWSLRFMIEVALRFSIRITNQRKGVERASVDDHERILDAILAGDQQAAEASMRSLILESKMLLYSADETRVSRRADGYATEVAAG